MTIFETVNGIDALLCGFAMVCLSALSTITADQRRPSADVVMVFLERISSWKGIHPTASPFIPVLRRSSICERTSTSIQPQAKGRAGKELKGVEAQTMLAYSCSGEELKKKPEERILEKFDEEWPATQASPLSSYARQEARLPYTNVRASLDSVPNLFQFRCMVANEFTPLE